MCSGDVGALCVCMQVSCVRKDSGRVKRTLREREREIVPNERERKRERERERQRDNERKRETEKEYREDSHRVPEGEVGQDTERRGQEYRQ